MKPQHATPTLHAALAPIIERAGWALLFWLLRHVVTPLVSFLAGVAVWVLSGGKAERW